MQLTCGNHYENIFVKINDFIIRLRPENFDFTAILYGVYPIIKQKVCERYLSRESIIA